MSFDQLVDKQEDESGEVADMEPDSFYVCKEFRVQMTAAVLQHSLLLVPYFPGSMLEWEICVLTADLGYESMSPQDRNSDLCFQMLVSSSHNKQNFSRWGK